MQSAQALFAKVYEQTQGAAGQAGPDMGAARRRMQAQTASPTMILLTETSEKYKIVPGFKRAGDQFIGPYPCVWG